MVNILTRNSTVLIDVFADIYNVWDTLFDKTVQWAVFKVYLWPVIRNECLCQAFLLTPKSWTTLNPIWAAGLVMLSCLSRKEFRKHRKKVIYLGQQLPLAGNGKALNSKQVTSFFKWFNSHLKTELTSGPWLLLVSGVTYSIISLLPAPGQIRALNKLESPKITMLNFLKNRAGRARQTHSTMNPVWRGRFACSLLVLVDVHQRAQF